MNQLTKGRHSLSLVLHGIYSKSVLLFNQNHLLVSLTDLLLKYEKSAIAVLPEIAECLEVVQDSKGLSAIIWILGEYGEV